ncbi:hypothetical protein LDG_7433 [Legionella drancourtii LLAP12]|uniref:Uncharacterized protein n=1 Tax=Legionella drancourtii LLAP12 TaxID=658187 RepID=G9EQ86_9GAMM|nr:hypothetical protein LDG_7433 [Legionella drancourtii LLAP12]
MTPFQRVLQGAGEENQKSKSANTRCNCWAELNQPYEGLSDVLGN